MNKTITFGLIAGLLGCGHVAKVKDQDLGLQVYKLNNPPSIGITKAGQKINLGGFSALKYEGQENGKAIFSSITDRGANPQEFGSLVGLGKNIRPILLPEFAPLVVRLSLEPSSDSFQVLGTQPLKLNTKKTMVGLPHKNTRKYQKHEVPRYEVPIDVKGGLLASTNDGVDPEGYCRIGDSTFIVEEYGPDLLMFDRNLVLKKRWRPGGGLPKVLATRKPNRGFEGLACDEKFVYLILQSPLRSGLPQDLNTVRLIKFDPKKEKVVVEYFYPIDAGGPDKIGDMTHIEKDTFLVIEQNGKLGSEEGLRKIYKIDLSTHDSNNLLKKDFVVDLNQVGFDFVEKIEGIALLDKRTIVIIGDNDFGLDGLLDLETGKVPTKGDQTSYMAIIKLKTEL